MRSALLVVMLSALAPACKGDPVECDQACRNYATLVHWKKTDAEIAAAPPEKRDTMKRLKIAEFENKLENGIDQCVAQCVSAHNSDQTHCMMEAKTADAVEACVK